MITFFKSILPIYLLLSRVIFFSVLTPGERGFSAVLSGSEEAFEKRQPDYSPESLVADHLEEKLRDDIDDGSLDDFRLIDAAFILSGITNLDSLKVYTAWYEQLVDAIKGFHLNPFDRVASASKVFSYIHSTWLLHYKEEATTLIDVVRTKEYNCVAGTILFNLLCEEMGWQTEAFETPTHVYTVFANFTENVTVENTSSMGFNIMRNLRAYSKYLLQFYPQNRALQIGYDKIYAYENSNGRKISNTELLGLLAYNRAYFAKKRNEYATAYDYVLLAQKFNRDSRSNVNFEIDLYFRWGSDLYKASRFAEAFAVYADGYYRHRKIRELGQNCLLAFQNAVADFWLRKDWLKTHELILEMLELDLLNNPAVRRLYNVLAGWKEYFLRYGMKQELVECLEIQKRLFEQD